MWNLNYDSPSDIDRVLKENSLAMSRKFGQNFLINGSMRRKIVDLIDADEGMRVWEIGPGLGAITHHLVEDGVDLTAFEIDYGFVKILREKAFPDESNFTLIEGDALKTLFKKRLLPLPERIIGNLPYNVGSVMIARLIEESYLPEKMVFTLQKEVVDRMVGTIGSESYSSFSILTQIDYENTLSLKLPRSCFWPQPNVESAVVVMKKREKSLVDDEYRATFLTLLRALFNQRRKTIRNNLQSSQYGNRGKEYIESILSRSSLDGGERAESLEIEKIVRLAEVIQNT